MDPALGELIKAGDAGDQVRVVARLEPGASLPPGVEVVSQLGDVATVRLPRGELEAVWADPAVASLKGPRVFDGLPALSSELSRERRYALGDERRPEGIPETGRGVVVACADWGLDFAHPDFRDVHGKTRLIALWDQRGGERPGGSSRHGYGTVHDRAAINHALEAADPYAALGYHPADADLGQGSHGTHCLSIAAGSGSPETPPGMAPEAGLVFVHLDAPAAGSDRPLGDSVTLLDALDFFVRTAGDAPIVISLSLGSHGGAHDETSPVVRAIDNVVGLRPGIAVCQSAGNYYERSVHTSGRLRPGDVERIGWLTERAEEIPHQLEVWYSGADRVAATLRAPEGITTVSAQPGESRDVTIRGTTVGRIYHRTREPNNGQNHINVFLYPAAPGGRWELSIAADDVADGRYHCWVERESGCPTCQSHLDETLIVKQYTTGSVCNGLRTIAVGAYDAHTAERPLAPFSSSGPTRDGRTKPDFAAPGVAVLAARSTPRGESPGARATRMSGTSMAAPHVAGTVALMFEAAARPLPIAMTRRYLSETAEPAGYTDERGLRIGDGYLDVERVLAAARAHAERDTRPRPEPRGEAEYREAEAMRGEIEPEELEAEAMPSIEALIPELQEIEAAIQALDAVAQGLPERNGAVVDGGPIVAGRLVVDEVPLLAAHRGRHPDLILHWNSVPVGESVIDVVVHLHGYSGQGTAMRLDLDKEPISGLDFFNPDDPTDLRLGRRRPTLCLLPRGDYFGGRSGAGYDHPALATPTGLRELIAFALERFTTAVGIAPGAVSTGRLILTAHSGGGATLMRILRHNDPHEVHVFDGLYGSPDALGAWATARVHADASLGAMTGDGGALRVLYRPGSGTESHSLGLAQALAGAVPPEAAARYRVEATTVQHNDIPRRFGWLLLADAAAQLPLLTQHHHRRRSESSASESTPVPVADETQLRAQWGAHPRVRNWFEGGLDGYLQIAPLYARNGIGDAAAYLDQNVVSCEFFGHRFPTHRSMKEALDRGGQALAAAGVAPDIRSIWSVNARPIRGRSSSLSLHALGLAVDINPDSNPLIRAADNPDVVAVIAAVTGVDLGSAQPQPTLRQASAAFRAGFGDRWLTQRRMELDIAQQNGDEATVRRLRPLLAAADRHDQELRRLARTGFFDLDQRLVDALVGAGLTWGGSWARSKDFMHFELHVAPTASAPATPGEPGTQAQPRPTPSSEPASSRTSGEPAPPAPREPAPPPGGTSMAPPPGAGVTLTPAQEQRIAQRYRHVLWFYRRYVELAAADQRASGVPAVFTLAQGGVESGWGRHMPGNMLFGVKANEHHVPASERQLLWTSEVTTDPSRYDAYEHESPRPVIDHATGQQATDHRGRPLYSIRVKQWFRKFASEAEAIANHSRFLRNNNRYAEAFQHTEDPVAFARFVARAGYATGQEAGDGYEHALIGAMDLVNRVAAYAGAHPEDSGTPPARPGEGEELPEREPELVGSGVDD